MLKIKIHKKHNNNISLAIFLFAILFVLAGCGSGGGGGGSSGSSGLTPVSINLNIPSAQQTSSPQLASLSTISGGIASGSASSVNSSAASAPVAVASLSIKISGPGMDDIDDVFNVTPGDTVSKTYDVPTGDDRVVAVNAHSGLLGSGALLYQGETKVNLSGTSTVVDIAMILTDIVEALELLNSGDIVGARDLFRAAVSKYAGLGDNNEDTANFFYALTRVLAIWFDMQYDGSNSALYDTGDILDAFGCSETGRDPANFAIHFVTATNPVPPFFSGIICPGDPLSPNLPTGGEFQTFLYNIVRTELLGAIENLSSVSQSFTINWTEPFSMTTVESDYGDVLVLRSMFKATMAALEIEDAYDLDVDINDSNNTVESFLAANSGFPVLMRSGNLQSARSFLTGSALDDIDDAIDWIITEQDNQDDDWINLINMTPLQILDAKNDIATARECVLNQCTIDDNRTPGDTSDDTIISLAPYFDGQVNINSLFPSFNGDDPTGLLPDPTFGGMLKKIKGNDPSVLNNDADGDGTADSIDKEIYYVYGGDILPVDPFSKSFRDDPASEGFSLIGAANSTDGTVDFNRSSNYYLVSNNPKEPSIVNKRAVRIDALEFIGTGTYCCDGNFLVTDWSLWWNIRNAPDNVYGRLFEGDIVLAEDIVGGTGLRVYSIP